MSTPPGSSAPLPSPDAPAVQALVSFLEHEAAPSIVLDTEYRILAANTAYQRQFGVSEQQGVLGHKCFRVSHLYSVPCDLAGEHCPMKRARETRAPDRVLHVHHTPRGPEHVDVELRPILDSRGEVVAYVERMTSLTTASARPNGGGLVGRSEAFNAALAAIQRAAPASIPVLLQGESGTGKEMFARALHEASPRARGPLVIVDCTGLSETLFESELFGHERGAFTGANQRKIGLAETAHGGTLFLDEIGDVPLPMQVKLLRLIESGTFRRVGGVDTLRADFRLVAATHKPLREMVEAQTFRQDLYYRISAFPVHLPSLRERRDDIPLLVDSLLRRIGGGQRLRIDDAALQVLHDYAFPGNVRELRNILERARLFADDGTIRVRDLPPDVVQAPAAVASARPGGRRQASRLALMRALATFDGTRGELAAHLGISERTLYRRLRGLQAD
ncbi:sigma-54 interaction domain-containing protein [Solimonas variicoloris]|uniref:sigma-54 interaction domain-containing protein n=1 Tax=Solimonas variicoloris TaxID=254408 RepID=UPI00039D3A40|nr:sigma 54-interacting transcriptional regulator [Solimonas variicoloris]